MTMTFPGTPSSKSFENSMGFSCEADKLYHDAPELNGYWEQVGLIKYQEHFVDCLLGI